MQPRLNMKLRIARFISRVTVAIRVRLAVHIDHFLLRRVLLARAPDLVIQEGGNVYMNRWWIIPRNRFFNVYLHDFKRSDDARALHDHPWLFNATYVLCGGYLEHTIDRGGIERVRDVNTGQVRLRFGAAPHRIELRHVQSATTLFITGPVMRPWGFTARRPGGFGTRTGPRTMDATDRAQRRSIGRERASCCRLLDARLRLRRERRLHARAP